MSDPREIVQRLRRTPPNRVPGKLARFALRKARARVRRETLKRSAAELSDRQLLRALGGRFATTAEVLAHFHNRSAPRFFVDAERARQRATALAAAYPEHARRTTEAAERVLAHVVDLLGSGPVQLGPTIDWQVDFTTGYRWPSAFYEDIDYVALDQHCDVKIPWELSRCHQWVTLGRAYALDPRSEYAAEFVRQLESWLAENPCHYGVNWGRAMEVAVRAVNWVWAWYLFADAPQFHEQARVRMLKSLLQHGRFILDNLEFSDNNGNHYLSNGVGLLFLGLLFPEFSEAAAWRRKGEEIVWGEIGRQVHPDGVDFEKGLGYQGLVIELWYSCVLLYELNGLAVPPIVRERLNAMFDFMWTYTRPDGTFPQIGDNDDGRLAGIDDEPVGSHCRHLAVSGAMFGRPELLGAAGDAMETAVWLLGEQVLLLPRQTAEQGSRAFPLGGYYVMRDADAVMVLDAGEVGQNGIGGHGHNDMLSFDLWAAGAPLIVDPGTFVYTGNPAGRQELRSSAAHNLVRIDGEEIARMGGIRWLWRIENDAHPTVHAWESSADRDVLDAEHDGYARLPQPIVHRRRVTFDKHARQWVIEDRIEGAGEHLVELFFHLASANALVEQSELAFRLRAPRADLVVAAVSPAEGLRLAKQEGWVSRAYGHREPAPVMVFSVRATLPLALTTALVLVAADTSTDEVRSNLQMTPLAIVGSAR